MRMASRAGVVFILLGLLFFGACKTPKGKTAFQTISFQYKYGNEVLAFNKVYGTSAGDSVRFSTAKIYLSNVELLKPDGSAQQINSILYFSQPDVLSANTLEIPEGNYTDIRFNFGLTDGQNSSDSTVLACPHPLCTDHDMWWDEVLKYTFVKLEGGVKKQGESEFLSLVYHVGTTPYLRTVTVTQPINVLSEKRAIGTIVLDIQQILDGANPMDFATERRTKTFDEPAVAGKFSDNIVNAFSVQ